MLIKGDKLMKYKYLNSIPKPLLIDFLNNQVIPFVGAGFSKNADIPEGLSMPDWWELGELAAQEIQGYKYENDPIDALSYFEDLFSRSKLIEFLLRKLNYGMIKPSDTYKAFCNLFTGTICTTNFDSLIEDTYTQMFQPVSVVATTDRLTIADKNERKIIKLHGDFNHPEKMVVTERDYDTYLDKNPIFATYIANLFISNTMLLIGYSLDDNDFRSIWQIINSRLSGMAQPAYCVLVNASEEKIAQYKRRNIRIINLKGDKKNYKTILKEFFNEINDYLSQEMDKKIQSGNEKINEQMVIPAEDNKLCFISCAMSRISQLSALLYPILQNQGITPVRIDDVIKPGDNFIDVTNAIIRKSKAAIVDISDNSSTVLLELGLLKAEKPTENILLICEEGTILPTSLTGNNYITYSFNDSYDKEKTFGNGIEKWCQSVYYFQKPTQKDDNSDAFLNDAYRILKKGEYSASIISACSELELYYNIHYQKEPIPYSIKNIFSQYFNNDTEQALHYAAVRNKIIHQNYKATEEEATEFLNAVKKIYDSIIQEEQS